MPLNVSIHQLRTSLPRSKHDQTKPPGFRILYARGSRRSCDLSLWPLVEHGALSQLNYTNGVQKRSFSKCGFSTCLAYKIKGKHVYSNIIVLFLQKITRGASWRPPRGPRVAPQNVRFKICPVFLLNELKTIYFSFKIYFWYILIVLGSCEVMGGLKIGSWGAKIRVFQKYFFQLFSTFKKRKLVSAQFRTQGWLSFWPRTVKSGV